MKSLSNPFIHQTSHVEYCSFTSSSSMLWERKKKKEEEEGGAWKGRRRSRRRRRNCERKEEEGKEKERRRIWIVALWCPTPLGNLKGRNNVTESQSPHAVGHHLLCLRSTGIFRRTFCIPRKSFLENHSKQRLQRKQALRSQHQRNGWFQKSLKCTEPKSSFLSLVGPWF